MAVHLNFLLILTGLTGIHSITTVSKVSVKAGDSISIPCLYGSQYRNHVKYLCKGRSWVSCSNEVQTETQGRSRKFSISDDKIQRIFTVIIKDLTDKDTDYWCAVKIKGALDVRKHFHLSVTSGTPSLYVDHQEISGFYGETITINCHGNPRGMKWCKLGSSCVSSPGSIDGARVTMSGLRTESSGWYLCDKGDLQMPVHVTVTKRNTMTTLATTQRLTTFSPTPTCVPVIGDRAVTTVKNGQESVSLDLKKIIIPLSVLIFTVMVTLFIWFMLKRLKQTKSASSALTEAEEEVTYSNVKHTRKTSSQRSNAERDVDVTYSSVVTMRQLNVISVEANDENVTYSTLAKH